MIDLAVFEKLLVAAEEVLELQAKVNVNEVILCILTKYVVTVSG